MVKEIFEWVKTIVIAVVIALVITKFVQPTLVKGHSMYPTLEPNNYLIINKIPYMMREPERGDIVVFKSELKTTNGKEKDLIKRVIAVEGDKIEVRNGKIFINGKQMEEEYINGDFTSGDLEITIPKHHVFVMGDNRQNSLDSRDSKVGPIDIDNIRGKVLVRLFPFDEIGAVD